MWAAGVLSVSWLSFFPAYMAILFLYLAQDPAGSGHERFHAAEETHHPEDGPQSLCWCGGVKEARTDQRLLFDGASSKPQVEAQIDVCAVEESVVQPPISPQGVRGLAQHNYLSIILMNTSPRSCCPWSQ